MSAGTPAARICSAKKISDPWLAANMKIAGLADAHNYAWSILSRKITLSAQVNQTSE